MTGEVSELKLQLERLVYEGKEIAITTDAMREQNSDLGAEVEELRVSSIPGTMLERVSLTYCLGAETNQRPQAVAEERHAGGQGQEEGREDGGHDGWPRHCA